MLSQLTTNSDQHNHRNNRLAHKTNGGILAKLSDDNLGEEDEIDCLVDDNDISVEEDEWESEGTLLRDAYENNRNNRLFEYRYHNGNGTTQKQHLTPVNFRNSDQNTAKEATLVPSSKPLMQIKETDYQNNENSSKRNSAHSKVNEPSNVPRVQRIFEKGKANLSRSKSELGEQHRKVLSQINKGKSGITEQNRRFLANITSGMDKSKRFVLPGFNFSSSTNTKHKQSQNEDVENSSLEGTQESLVIAQNSIVQTQRPDVNIKKTREMVDSVSQESLNTNSKTSNHIGETVNHDLDQMLTNLGIQISAAEAATSESICYSSSSKVVPSLMTQSVFVTSDNQSTSTENKTRYSSKLNVDKPQINHSYRTHNDSNSTFSYTSERSVFSKNFKDEEQKQILTNEHFENANNNNTLKAKVKTTDLTDTEKSTNKLDINAHKIAFEKRGKEETVSNKSDIDDYLRLEKSLENDYGEFDFIDGDSTLNRTSVPPSISNINNSSSKFQNDHKFNKTTERGNKSNVSLLDEVVEEIDRDRKNIFSTKENHRIQAKVREKSSTKGTQNLADSFGKKSRRLSSSSLSSASLCEQTNSYLASDPENINHLGTYSSFKSPLSTTRNNDEFIPSVTSHIPNVSVYADHTLMLRSHHKRRRWLLIKSQTPAKKAYEYNNREIKTDQIHLQNEQSVMNPSLRRCSSLAQNFYSESSSDNSPFVMINELENNKKVVNCIKQLDNKDQGSQKLLLLKDVSNRHTVFGTDSIDSDNNNSAKNETNATSWLSTPFSNPVKNMNTYSNALSKRDFPAKTHDQFHDTERTNTGNSEIDIQTTSNSSNENKPCFRQRSRRSPWLLRSNLSNYARRRRGSSTSLHTIGLNEDEVTKENVQSSLNAPVLIVQNGASNSNLPTDNDLYEGKSIDSSGLKKQNGFISNNSESSFIESDLPSVTENNAMSLNRR